MATRLEQQAPERGADHVPLTKTRCQSPEAMRGLIPTYDLCGRTDLILGWWLSSPHFHIDFILMAYRDEKLEQTDSGEDSRRHHHPFSLDNFIEQVKELRAELEKIASDYGVQEFPESRKVRCWWTNRSDLRTESLTFVIGAGGVFQLTSHGD